MSISKVREMLDRLGQDARFGIRQLARERSFAIAAIATLGVGIGATAAVFSVVEAVVLRPFPFAQPNRVVDVHPTHDGAPLPVASNLEFATWRALPGVFDALVATTPQVTFTLIHGDAPEVVTGTRATSALTRVLGVAPELGRGFSTTDDQVGAPHVVILSHRIWVRDYNSDPKVLGRQVRIDDETYSIIGVMPTSLDPVSNGTELWVPLALSTTDLLDFKTRNLQLVGRLAAGVTLSQAAAAVDQSEQRLAAQYPMWGTGYKGTVTLYSADLIGNLQTRLFILFGAVSFVFLIACVNVANLLLARGTDRAREIGIRVALGAPRGRIIAQLLTESGVLCVVGGATGVALSWWLVKALVAASPPGLPRIDQARIDTPVLLCTFLIAALCGVIVGLLPALRAADPTVDSTLREGGRGIGQSKERVLARGALVGAEVALAMALLTGAGLLIRTGWAVGRVDPGFASDHVLTAQVVLPSARYGEFTTGLEAYRAILDAVQASPGVQSAALAATVPMTPSTRSGIGAEGRPMIDGERQIAMLRPVTPNYFATMKIRMLAGRDFLQTDNASSPNVAIINETLAKKFWPGEEAVGKRMEGMDPSHQHFMEVVGVIADPRDAALDKLPEPEFYIPLEQSPPPLWAGIRGSISVIARTAADPSTMESSIRRAVDAVDPSLPIANVLTMDELVKTTRAAARFNTLLLSVLAAIALGLASVGIYGVIAYSTGLRTREIGLRMALGAPTTAIAALVIRGALAPTVIGAAVGIILSALTTGVLREQLYGVTPGDPTTVLAIAVLLCAVSAAAACIPTWRAIKISPVTALGD